MFAISVEFLGGTFRADPRGEAHTGRSRQGEWPPSPARLLGALTAADGTAAAPAVRRRRTTGAELLTLEKLGAPTIYADPWCWHQPLPPRYVASPYMSRSQHMEHTARVGIMVRPGVRVSLRFPHVCFLWDAQIDDKTETALRYRAARVGYLGCSDSPVRVCVSSGLPSRFENQPKFVPAADGDTQIAVPVRGHVEALDSMYSDWQKRGPNTGRYQYPILEQRTRYRSPLKHPKPLRDRERTSPGDDTQRPLPAHGRVVASFQLKTAAPGRLISTITDLFKAAVLSHCNKNGWDAPRVLHGHGYKGQGYELARFLALPDVGYKHSRGRVHGLALWLPPGVDRQSEQRIKDAAASVTRLTGRGLYVRVAHVSDLHNRKAAWAAIPSQWEGPAKRWVTAIPAIHERYGPLNLKEISRWCAHAGLPNPIRYRPSRSPLLRGGLSLSMDEVSLPGRPPRPFSHVEFCFDRPIHGPVVIGAGRQRGFGLCAPMDKKRDSVLGQGN